MERPAKRVSGPLASLDAPYRSWLAAQGFMPGIQQPVPAGGPVERVLVDYRWYLERGRALVEGTISRCVRIARLFLEHCAANGVAVADLTAAQVSGRGLDAATVARLLASCDRRGTAPPGWTGE